ncbi:MAG TPA: bacillithiol biosynthesis cysteine-adding enzyme BshC [Niabella sp.]|jgi:bacillithiol biosynthesis cysteine-adding enzyme BshC|nr:bacillithiol biosynthesis cysteine-adding enzyme BshC [Chitinophagaceae bacterium]HRO83363.1 bacillithiol biosynthesis cysteine-adding enzyme BshC [Niabella sp.]HUN01959.1 bacillithiol biosynthesis cysteine-adding enzyme BshC [Niabella sp.]
MDCTATKIPYSETGYFSHVVTDYLKRADALRDAYKFYPDVKGIEAQIQSRLSYQINRKALVEGLKEQYQNIETSQATKENIELLADTNTFTITTAHQPNIFTGPLYFIYKILHAIKLAVHCKELFPQYRFVPVFFMGSEDADLDELGHIYLNNEKLEWKTAQTGAVGRMKVDKQLLQLIGRIESEVGVLPHAEEIIGLVKKYYAVDTEIQIATLGFVNELFKDYGLVVLVPDSHTLKSIAIDLFKEELLNQSSEKPVETTGQILTDRGYKTQAFSREINLFYLNENGRNRIVKEDEVWKVLHTDIVYNKDEILKLVETKPELFSPNVILRGVFQEMLLPNVSFIGGGGELAYWLQLKGLFDYLNIPYPILVLRNSFLFIDKKNRLLFEKLGFNIQEVFLPIRQLQEKWVKKNTGNKLEVKAEREALRDIYDSIAKRSIDIDITLQNHVEALKTQALKKLIELEKKMLRAEKRNYMEAMSQIERLKDKLFPLENLQERMDNIIIFYAKYGKEFIDACYHSSMTLEQEFVILNED